MAEDLTVFDSLPDPAAADLLPTYQVADYLRLTEFAAAELLDYATTAGRARPVPTCPGWTAAGLVAHLTMVYSWAQHIISQRRQDFPDHSEIPAQPDPVTPADMDRALRTLVDTLTQAPADLATAVFLKRAGPPRWFWARRLAHETMLHRVDALSAKLGRLPVTAEADIPLGLALDGIDELLRGFVTRKSSKLRTPTPATFVVNPDDANTAWTVALSPDPAVVELGAISDPDAVLLGSSADLYLGLWNRGDEIACTGDNGLLGLWRDKMRIAWS